MFPCGCSLRSTQCAALIALATAAGALRMDAIRAGEPVRDTPAAIQGVSDRAESRIQFSRYEVALRVLAPWLRLLGFSVNEKAASPALALVAVVASVDMAAAHDADARGAERRARLALSLSQILTVSDQAHAFAWTLAAPTAREHARPFAAGPPARGGTPTFFCI